MSNKNEFKSNHYVPEAFLKAWARVVDGKKQGLADTWVLREGRLLSPKNGGISLKNIACDDWLYVISDGDIEINAEKSFFQDVHDKGATVINGLRDGAINFHELSREQQCSLELYVASFRAMNPQQMKKYFDYYQSVESPLKTFLAKDEDSLRIHNALISKAGKATQPGISALSAVTSTIAASKHLGKKYWGFRELSSQALLMSDNPVPYLLEETVTLLPISRTQVMVIAEDMESLCSYLWQKDALLSKAVNLCVMKHATLVISTNVDIEPRFIEKRLAWGDRGTQADCEAISSELMRQIDSSELSDDKNPGVRGPEDGVVLLEKFNEVLYRSRHRFPSFNKQMRQRMV